MDPFSSNMKDAQMSSDWGEPTVPLWIAYLVFGCSFITMLVLSSILQKVGKPKRVKEDVEFWIWRSYVISILHAFFIGIWDILCIVWYPELFQDKVLFNNNFVFLMLPVSMGYFLYDFYDMVRQGTVFSDYQMTVHHLLLITAVVYNWSSGLCIPYCTIVLMAEVNSVFLHARKMLQFISVDYKSLFYRWICMMNLFSFVVCRIIPQFYVLITFNLERHRIPNVQYWLLFSTYPVGIVQNLNLFWMLFKSDVIRPIAKRKSE